MASSRKIIFHGKAHDVSEREEDSSKAAKEIAAKNKKARVKLFFEGYCIGQQIPQERRKKFAFEPTPIERREILDFEILVSCAAIVNKAAITRKISQIVHRGEREKQYGQIIEEDFEEDFERRNLQHMLNFGKFTNEEIADISKALGEKGYIIQPVLRRIIRAKLEQIKTDQVLLEAEQLRRFFEAQKLGGAPKAELEYSKIYRELRFLEPKGEADPIKVAFMLDDAMEEAGIIREARIVRSILETNFEIGILNIGLGHIETGRIEKWLREMGVETESDPKTNKLKYEMKELFEKNKRKEGELEKLRREFYQDLI
jgi:hypothetical protein